MVKTFNELIGKWPRGADANGRQLTSIGTFAADMGIEYVHAQIMRYRNSVSADYWPALLDAAKRRGLHLAHEDLTKMRKKRTRARPSRAVVSNAARAA